MSAAIELFPPQKTADGIRYRAVIYTADNERVELTATATEGLRRRAAAKASKALAWVREHVRVPEGPISDLMAGVAPECGCDVIGDAFRSAALQTAEVADAYPSGLPEGVELAWCFDDWDGSEQELVPDVVCQAMDAFGGALRVVLEHGGDGIGAVTPPRAIRPGKVVARVQPGLAALQTAFAAVLSGVH